MQICLYCDFSVFFKKNVLEIFIVALSLILLVNLFQARIVLGRKLLLYLDVQNCMCFKLFMFLVAYVCWLGCGSKLCKYVGVIVFDIYTINIICGFFRLCYNVSHPNSLYNFTVSLNLYEFRQIIAHFLCNLSKRFNLVIVLLLYIILPYSMIGLMKDSYFFGFSWY